MSKKATCADDAAMEKLMTYTELKQEIEKYIEYYNNERIKIKLVSLSPGHY